MKRLAQLCLLVLACASCGNPENVHFNFKDNSRARPPQDVSSIKLNAREIHQMVQDYVDKSYGKQQRKVVAVKLNKARFTIEVYVTRERTNDQGNEKQ